jgi:hypothetical protein
MAWKKPALKHSQTISCAKFDFMDMLLKRKGAARFKFGSAASTHRRS